MRTGQRAGEVFDALLERGEIVVHPTEVERLAALAELTAQASGDLRHRRHPRPGRRPERRHPRPPRRRAARSGSARRRRHLRTAGERVGLGDRVATRRNDRDLDVANRDRWTVTAIDDQTAA